MSSLRKRAKTADLTPTTSGSWRNLKHQNSLGSEYIILEPQGTWPEPVKYLQFELPANKVLKFNERSYFNVKCKLMIEKTISGAKTWQQIEASDVDKFTLMPNWFDFLVKKIDLICGNQTVSPHNLPDNVLPMFNTFLYYYMDPKIKNKMASNPIHPARYMATPTTAAPDTSIWGPASSASQTFNGEMLKEETGFSFEWIPLNTFPFSQKLNHCYFGPQESLPMQNFEKMYIRITFVDDFKTVFKYKDGETDKVRVDIVSMKLILEEDKLAPSVKIPKRSIKYEGHSFTVRHETINSGETIFKTKFMKEAMPQQLAILAINKKVIGGLFDYRTHSGTKYFTPTNLKSIKMIYDGHEISSKVPNFQDFDAGGTSTLILKNVLETNGLFGMKFNPDFLTYKNCKNEFGSTLFPFNLVDYTLKDGTDSRVYPTDVSASPSIYNKDAVIELQLNFGTGGAPADVTFLFVLMYYGTALTYEAPTNRFVNVFANLKTV